jgi:hypothetical protein
MVMVTWPSRTETPLLQDLKPGCLAGNPVHAQGDAANEMDPITDRRSRLTGDERQR